MPVCRERRQAMLAAVRQGVLFGLREIGKRVEDFALCQRKRRGEIQIWSERMVKRKRSEALAALGEYVGGDRTKGRDVGDLAGERAVLNDLCGHFRLRKNAGLPRPIALRAEESELLWIPACAAMTSRYGPHFGPLPLVNCLYHAAWCFFTHARVT